MDIGEALISECRRRLYDESLPRIRKCLGELTVDEIWARPNEQTVSAGNLVLHLAGNVRQYIVATLEILIGEVHAAGAQAEHAVEPALPGWRAVVLAEMPFARHRGEVASLA